MSWTSWALPALGAGAGFLIGGPAGAAVGASIGSGVSSAMGAADANAAAQKSVEWQAQYSKEMSDSAHQREVLDLQKAGLNPILSAKYGGASTPSIGLPNIRNVNEGVPTATTSAVHAGLSVLTQKAAIAQTVSQADLNSAETAKVKAETDFIKSGMGNTTKQPWYIGDLKKSFKKPEIKFNSSRSKHSFGTTGQW